MVDYTNQGFIIQIEMEGARGYASVNAMLCREDDGLETIGNYFVYLLHPKFGSTDFILEPLAGSVRPFKKLGGAYWLESEIVQIIIDEIKRKKSPAEAGQVNQNLNLSSLF